MAGGAAGGGSAAGGGGAPVASAGGTARSDRVQMTGGCASTTLDVSMLGFAVMLFLVARRRRLVSVGSPGRGSRFDP